ncbi:MAG: bidirectional hydrogenase complex protein HoxE [Acidobacteriota bacterium]
MYPALAAGSFDTLLLPATARAQLVSGRVRFVHAEAAANVKPEPRLPAPAIGEHIMPLYAERPPLPSDDKRWRIVNGTMRKHGYSRNALIETLHTVQSSFGFLDEPAIKFVAQSLRVPLSQAYGVVTFYHFFSLKPPGKHTCTICTGTACYIKGSDKLVAQTEKLLHIHPGQTTPDGEVSFTTARCVGACGRAPVVLLDGELSGQMEAAELQTQLERWTTQ